MRSWFLLLLLLIISCNPLDPQGAGTTVGKSTTSFEDGPGRFEITSSSTTIHEVTLSWGISKNASSYQINYRLLGSSSFIQLEASPPFVLGGLVAGMSYEIYVSAFNEAGSAQSSVLTLTLEPSPAPIAHNITPTGLVKGNPTIIDLSYTDSENGLASTCSVISLVNLNLTTPCTCSASICSAEVSGITTGAASFSYSVVVNGHLSNSATATTTVDGLQLFSSAYKFASNGYGTSCKAYIDSPQYDAEGSGLYWIDPDGSGAGAPMKAFCEMTHQGGGWTLITHRRGSSNNAEDCGLNLNGFFQAPCGTVDAINFTSSYNLGGANLRTSLLSQGEWLFYQADSGGVVDDDDAFILHSATDLFPNTVGVLARLPIDAVCDYNNSNCDSTGVLFYLVGDGWFSSSQCNGNFENSAPYQGNYGYCQNGIGSYDSNGLFGNRSSYNETKLWNFGTISGALQEFIFVR